MITAKQLETYIQQWGEVMVPVEEIPEPVELHAHDTELQETGVFHTLSDGEIFIEYERMGTPFKHYASLEDYGLE